MTEKGRGYNLQERTTKFAESVIDLLLTIRLTAYNSRIIEQLVGSAGSIGANYAEATESESKKDFIHKLSITKKEIKETLHWLQLLAHIEKAKVDELRKFWQEAHELLLIISSSINSTKRGIEKKHSRDGLLNIGN